MREKIIRPSILIGLILVTVLLTAACARAAQPMASETLQPPTKITSALVTTDATVQATGLPAGEISLTDGLTRTVTLSGPAQRIVSLSPSNTEILFALGAGSQMVGRDEYSDYPEEAQSITSVGGGFSDLNTEMIISLKPDLVLVGNLTPLEQVDILEDLGLTVFSMANPTDLEGMYASLITVGQLTGRQAEAETLIVGLKERVAAIAAKTANVDERPLIFYEIDSTDPTAIWAPGPGTFVHTLITMAGGENLTSMLTSSWGQINAEELITRNPDFILLGDATWGGVTVETVISRPGWDTMKAVQNKQVFPFDDNLVSRPGPRLVDGLEGLAKLFHPELFQ